MKSNLPKKIDPKDMQFMTVRTFKGKEIVRFFKVPSTLLIYPSPSVVKESGS